MTLIDLGYGVDHNGTVLRGDTPADEVTTHVLSPTDSGPEGVRLLASIPHGGPLVAVPAVAGTGRPATLLVLTAPVDARLRHRIRVECAELEAVLTRVDPRLVLPLLDHGQDPDGRPYLLVGAADEQPGPVDPAEAARTLADGLRQLAEQGLICAPPHVHRTAAGFVLGTPLPPVVVEVLATHGVRDGHEPPEVLAGGEWTPGGQAYACALALMPYAPVGSPARDVLHRATSQRPEHPGALADQLATVVPMLTDPHLPIAPRETGRPLGSRYLLDAVIGRGATGVVWAGRRRDDDTRVAVKLLRSELAEDPDVVTRFLRERTVLVRLRHPHLVQVHDLVAEGEVLGIVMDLVTGEDLRRRAAKGRLAPTEAATLLAQVADALAAVHAANLVHRDIKPENVLLTERGGETVALLSDFGIARAVEGSAHTEMIGTPAYIAPELVAGRPPAQPADIYALGVTAYELLAGVQPFVADSTAALLQAHLHQPVTRPQGVSDGAWELLEATLRKEPEARPKAAEVAFRFAHLAGQAGSQPLPPLAPYAEDTAMSARPVPVPPKAPEPKKRSRKGRAAVLATVAVLGLGGGAALAYAGTRGDDNPNPGQTNSPAASQTTYVVPATIERNGTTATLTWPTQNLPGLRGFYVYDVAQRKPLSETLPTDATSYLVTTLTPGQSCFTVVAIGVTTPQPNPLPQPACVTLPPS